MARVFKMWVEIHPPNAARPDYCVETYEQIRGAQPNRILHFGLGYIPGEEDVDFVIETISVQLRGLIDRTVGVQQKLEF